MRVISMIETGYKIYDRNGKDAGDDIHLKHMGWCKFVSKGNTLYYVHNNHGKYFVYKGQDMVHRVLPTKEIKNHVLLEDNQSKCSERKQIKAIRESSTKTPNWGIYCGEFKGSIDPDRYLCNVFFASTQADAQKYLEEYKTSFDKIPKYEKLCSSANSLRIGPLPSFAVWTGDAENGMSSDDSEPSHVFCADSKGEAQKIYREYLQDYVYQDYKYLDKT